MTPAKGPDRRLPVRLSGAHRVWLLTAASAAVAALLYDPVVRHLPALDAPVRLPWWALAAAFAVAEILVVHIQFRREAHSFSLGDIPLVLGLFFVGPAGLVLAQLVGSAVALTLWRRQSPLKLAFNVSHSTFEACLAALIFTALSPAANPLGPEGWVAAFAATAATDLLGAALVGAAIALAERSPVHLLTTPRVVGVGVAISGTNAAVALLAVTVLWLRPEAAWLFLIPAAILVPAYRAYTEGREQHAVLASLLESIRQLQHSLRVETMAQTLLSKVLTMFRSETAEMTLFPTLEEDGALRFRLRPGETLETERDVELDPTVGVWARVAAEEEALLLARPIRNDRIREHFAGEGIRDAMVVPLRGKSGVVGTMLVGNRLGDVSTFDTDDLTLFEALASHASVSLENARLVDRLEDSLVRLTEMNRMKDDFVATVSHELRTPLTSIHGSVKTLLHQETKLDEGIRRSLLEVIDRQSDRLVLLIEDLLTASRIESDRLEPQLAPVEVAELSRRVVEDFRPRAQGHMVEMQADDACLVETDERKVRQILTNLVENALKYSPAETTVTVRCRTMGDSVLVTVQDEGAGIPSELHDRIFERFYQVDQTITRTVGGTGLGLYICRRLAEIIGGGVTLERSDERGSVFRLSIPVAPPVGARPFGDPGEQELRAAPGRRLRAVSSGTEDSSTRSGPSTSSSRSASGSGGTAAPGGRTP